jgi:hypothetical protein
VSGGIFCNLEKAFDSVNHYLFLSKLPYFWISGKAELLLESYLNNRYQIIKTENSHNNYNISNWTRNGYVVPQGSILGPLLFLLHINYLPKAIADTRFICGRYKHTNY